MNNAPDAAITAWADNRRTIQFSMHVEAPAFLKRIVGVDSAKVTETQTVTFNTDGTISLRSVPVPNIPGGDKFTTQIDTLLALSSDGSGCLVSRNASAYEGGGWLLCFNLSHQRTEPPAQWNFGHCCRLKVMRQVD